MLKGIEDEIFINITEKTAEIHSSRIDFLMPLLEESCSPLSAPKLPFTATALINLKTLLDTIKGF